MIDRNIICDVHTTGRNRPWYSDHQILFFTGGLGYRHGRAENQRMEWLDAAGICNFQGELFATPRLNGAPVVAWPEVKQEYQLRDQTPDSLNTVLRKV